MKAKFKKLVEQNRWLRYVPNSLTLCNSLCGFAAILYTLRAYEGREMEIGIFAISAWIILCAMVFDALDGFAARIFNAASMHGVQMDSLADMVTFGVAPATLVAIFAHKLRGELMPNQELLIYLLCSVYLGGAALRLATYNVYAIQGKKEPSGYFSGLPSPGAAAAVCCLVMFAQTEKSPEMVLANWLPVYAAVLGLLMVSPFRYFHFAKWVQTAFRNRKRLIILLALIVAVILFRTAAFAVLITLYVVGNPVYDVIRRFREKKTGQA